MSDELNSLEFEGLSRENQVIWLASDGKTDKTIAQLLGISTDTVSTYWKRIMVKYDSSSRTEVVATFLQAQFEDEIEQLEAEKIALKAELKSKSAAEQQQQVATAHLNSLMNLLDVGVLFTGNGLKVTYINEQLCVLAGCELTPKELIGTDLEFFLNNCSNRPVDTRETTYSRLKTLVGEGSERSVDQMLMTDGRVLERTFCSLTVRGKSVGYLILYKDVTAFVNDNSDLTVRSRLSQELAERAIAHLVAKPTEQSTEISRTLEIASSLLHADRSMIAEIDLSQGTFSVLYAWRKSSDEVLIDINQTIPLSFLPWLKKQVLEREYWIIDNVQELPNSASMEKSIYQETGVQSTIGVRFTSNEKQKVYFVDFSYSKLNAVNRSLIEALIPLRSIFGATIEQIKLSSASKK